MKYLDQLDIALNKALMIAGGVAMLLLMILATGNVVMRILSIPFSGSYEIISFLGAVVTAAALGHTQRNRDHIVVDILSGRFPVGVKKIIDAVSYFIITVFFAVVSWQTFLWGMKIRESGELSETLKIIYHPFVFGVALGFAFLALAGIVDFLKVFFNGENGEGRVSYE
ncbi:MAG: TRAP transporter small permease [Deltaproteobacteria bacterium]|nr:TRAP transporter small permease [Deltaproteobacteria bacterium]